MNKKISSELKKKKKNLRRSRQGNVIKQSSRHNADKGKTRYNDYDSDVESYHVNEHMTNEERITID